MSRNYLSSACVAIVSWLAQVGMIGSLVAEDAAFGDILNVFEAASESIESYDIDFTVVERYFVKKDPNQSGSGPPQLAARSEAEAAANEKTMHFRQALSRAGKRLHAELEKDSRTPIELFVSDGEIERRLRPDLAAANLRTASLKPIPSGQDYLGFFRNGVGIVSIASLLRDRQSDSIVDCQFEGGLVMIDAPSSDKIVTLKGTDIVVLFDPDRGMMPVRIQRYNSRKSPERILRNDVIVTDFHEFASGKWAPINCMTKIYVSAGRIAGQLQVESRFSVDVAASRWNIDLEDEMFSLSIPRGTKVVDELSNSVYSSGAEESPNLPPEVMVAKAEKIIETLGPLTRKPMTTNPAAPNSRRSMSRFILNIGNALVILVVVICYAYSRMHKR